MHPSVSLGPATFMHPGLHGSLAALRNRRVAIEARDGVHHFLLPKCSTGPLESQSYLDLFEPTGSADVVHGAGALVKSPTRWVVDFDSFTFSAFVGHYGVSRDWRRGDLSEDVHGRYLEVTSQRVDLYTQVLAHEACHAIIGHTDSVAREVASVVQRAAPHRLDRIASKVVTVPPGVPAVSETIVHGKWQEAAGPLKVVFACRYQDGKKTDWIARVVDGILRHYTDAEVQVYCVGAGLQLPDEAAKRVVCGGSLDRFALLTLLRDAHMVCQTSVAESVGMLPIEAAASGAAICLSDAPGTAHYRRWFGDGGALYIHPSAEDWVRHVVELVRRRDLLKQTAMSGFDTATKGILSWAKRADKLESLYQGALNAQRKCSEPRIEIPADARWVSLSTRKLAAAKSALRDSLGIRPGGVTYVSPIARNLSRADR